MDEEIDSARDPDAWPMPSRETLRDLERPAAVWTEPDRDAEPPGTPSRGGRVRRGP